MAVRSGRRGRRQRRSGRCWRSRCHKRSMARLSARRAAVRQRVKRSASWRLVSVRWGSVCRSEIPTRRGGWNMPSALAVGACNANDSHCTPTSPAADLASQFETRFHTQPFASPPRHWHRMAHWRTRPQPTRPGSPHTPAAAAERALPGRSRRPPSLWEGGRAEGPRGVLSFISWHPDRAGTSGDANCGRGTARSPNCRRRDLPTSGSILRLAGSRPGNAVANR